ncbi:MAG: hypothetical protein J7M05_12475 [Anaerolineae bacterium]|nr:hypothetical protein [Anaerolineae bacterium]
MAEAAMERLDGEQALREVLEDVGLESPLEEEAAKPSISDRLQGFSPHLRLLGVFVLGLLVGWFVLGWWIWPVRWTNTDPWDLREEHQIHFLMFLAEDYWYNADIRQVQKALDGWDRQALEETLNKALHQRELTPERRQHLEALAEALDLPLAETSLWSTLLANKGFLIATFLSALPMLLAVGLIFSPLLKGAKIERKQIVAQPVEEEQEEEQEKEDLAEDELWMEDGLDEEEEGEGEEDDEGLIVEEETEEVDEEVSDVLSSFFDEDDQSLEQLQALAKDLPELDVRELAEMAKRIAAELTAVNELLAAKRAREQEREPSVAA